MSSTPQDVTDRGEGMVARSLRYAEWVIAGLCAWSLLYVPALLAMVIGADQQDWNALLTHLWYCSINLDCLNANFHFLFRKPSQPHQSVLCQAHMASYFHRLPIPPLHFFVSTEQVQATRNVRIGNCHVDWIHRILLRQRSRR
jgi:hypothetical protein